ncbi:MAG: hypothetical protein A3G75_01115 [Verrucomicrobia bacterium RIFCSPLOWO2_12_FULL_64_8]|nr:MAG: hypothetical protein A3G75_01115 [Verrucomicrobia bacterium RIFCSPLOWO2_12_FULL_64_8]
MKRRIEAATQRMGRDFGFLGGARRKDMEGTHRAGRAVLASLVSAPARRATFWWDALQRVLSQIHAIRRGRAGSPWLAEAGRRRPDPPAAVIGGTGKIPPYNPSGFSPDPWHASAPQNNLPPRGATVLSYDVP